ncbi:MAG: hypothetical protein QMC79_07365 [Anaerosomatales bacterium]|nr:hypothetical protein [Anaerosomatales bacterium]
MLEFNPIIVGGGGRSRCRACHGSAEPVTYRAPGDIATRIAEVVSASTAVPGPNILLTGADPFGHPELPALVEAAVSAGVERIAIDTDGAALRAGDNAAGSLHAGVRHYIVRVTAADEALSVRVTGGPSGPAALAGIAAVRAAAQRLQTPIAIEARVEACRHTIAALPSTVAALAEAGADAVRITVGDVPRSAETSALLAAACDTGMVNAVWVDVVGDTALLPATHALHMTEEDADALP